MYQIPCDDDDLEPRTTPKPSTKADYFTGPLVPEVSLIFDKPFKESVQHKNTPAAVLKSIQQQDVLQKQSLSSPSSNNGSYAAWRTENFCWKSTPMDTNNRNASYSQNSDGYKERNLSQSEVTLQNMQQHAAQYNLKSTTGNTMKHKDERTYNKNLEQSRYVSNCKQEAERTREKEKMDTESQSRYKPEITKRIQSPRYKNSNVNSPKHKEHYSHETKSKYNHGQQTVLVPEALTKMPMQHMEHQQNALHKNEFSSTAHMPYPYPYLDMNGYPFPAFYAGPFGPHNTENQETVKNLLQLVNSQSEQIKSLQLQVDQLLKMQEECFKEKQKCTCNSQVMQHNEQLLIENHQNFNPHYMSQHAQCEAGSTSQLPLSRDHSKDSISDNRKGHQQEFTLPDGQSKKAFMEQKVSIGVMTSFEFTVQNNPFSLESENYEKNETHTAYDNNKKMCNGMNGCERNENGRRYKNSFTRLPSGQLENIVEDSESYLSSSQQHSSNLNASISIRDQEKPVHIDVQKEHRNANSDSPRIFEADINLTTDRTIGRTEGQQPQKNSSSKQRNPNAKNPTAQKDMGNRNIQHFPNSKMAAMLKDQRTDINEQEYCKPTIDLINSPLVYSNKYQNKEYATTATNNPVEDSMVFNSGDLRVNERPPTPEPSIHVEMNEYSSDDESDKVKRTSKVGWTFYNNVLGQVNQILQNNSVTDDQSQSHEKTDNINGQDNGENVATRDTVKVATLEQLRKLGISLCENSESREVNGTKMAFDSTFYPRLDCQANMMHTTSGVNETNTSMHMKALALKYLSDDQLAELAIQRQGSASLKQLMLSNMQGTNMSFATMRYLERYQLLPGKNNVSTEGNAKVNMDPPAKPELKFVNPKQNPAMRFPFNQTPRTTCPSKILDISTLKQQPKLL